MKKLLFMIIAFTLGLIIVSCGGDTTCTEHKDTDGNGKCDVCGASTEPSGSTETGNDLVLVSSNKTQFAVVIADSLTDKAEGYVNDFIKNLNRYYLADNDLKTNYDSPGFDDVAEIIFGSPKNRGDEFKKDEHYLGYKGFSIELIGNKLFVLAGSEKAYQDAIKYLEEALFDLEGYGNDVIDELVIPAGTKYEFIPTDYDVTSLTIDGKNAKDFVITYTAGSKVAKAAAEILQSSIYKKAGIWIPYTAPSSVTDEQSVIYVEFTKGDKDRTTDNGCITYVKGGDLHIECEFENKLDEIVYDLIDARITTGNATIPHGFTQTKDIRNIYYKDFGAVGDGVTDDFFAIKACHDYANLYGHTVNATRGATYYIGTANGTESISVKTDTYLNLCSFIWDDRDVPDPGQGREYLTYIFKIESDKDGYTISGSKLPVTSLPSGSTTIGDWKPGERVLVSIYNNNKRQYIRYGVNRDNGEAQNEIIIVHPDGTIDASTPVQWDYETLTKMVVYPADDTPIVFSGGTKDQVNDYSALGKLDNYDCIDRAIIYTHFNDAPSAYTYFARTFKVTRSNTTIKNIQHVLYDDVEQSAPYNGFFTIMNCSDVLIEGVIFQKQKPFKTTGASGDTVGMGSYENNANSCNNITWRHCRQSNFFEPDGSTKSRGNMGTNYCRNLVFDDVVTCSFDAHKNLYNATIKDSVCEHLNYIGAGTIRYENVTVYTDGNHSAITLRQGHGSTWHGDVIIDGLTLKTSKDNDTISLITVSYINHEFGYTCYLPQNIHINNVKIIKYGFEVKDGVRREWEIATNSVPLHLYASLEEYKYSQVDISDPNADMSLIPNDHVKCNCYEVYKNAYPNDESKWLTFNNTDGDGKCNNKLNPTDSYEVWCWGYEDTPNTNTNVNPYIPTKNIYVTNCADLILIVPDIPLLKDTKLYIDGELEEK